MKILPSRITAQDSFKRQIILTFVVGFFFLAAAFTVYQVRTESAYLYRGSTDETISLAESLAASSLSWVLANDVVGLQEVVHSFQSHPELRYAMVISPSGKVLAHSDAVKVGQFVSDEPSLALIKAPPVNRVMIDDQYMSDVAVPIMIEHRHVGWARIAQGREGITGNLHKMMLSSALFVLMAVALSLFAALLIANRLGYRIGYLMRVAEAVQAGNYATRANISGVDEIARLSNSLNHMLDVLARDEEQLRESEALFQAVLKILPVGLWVADAAGQLVFGNDKGKQIWAGKQFVGIEQYGKYKGYWLDNGKPLGPHDWGMARAIEKGEISIEEEIEIECFDGTRKIIFNSALPLRRSDGSVSGAIGVNQDITERKQAEFEREQYFKFFNTSTDLMCIADPNGCFKKINPACSQLLGYADTELLAKPFIEFVHPDDRQETLDEMARQIQRGFSLKFENRYLCKDGSFRWLSWSANFIKDEGITYATARDITESKRVEAELRALKDGLEIHVAERTAQLEAANKELESFSYSVSHDLRTPLRAIDGFSRILLDDYADKLDDEGKRLLNVVRDNTSRMGHLIDDILKFSRTSRLEMTFSEVDMEKLAHEVVEELQPAVADGKLQVEIEPIPPATGDRAMMHQVLVNLLSNAIKFSRSREPAVIKVGGFIKDDEAVYFVRDNGAGFDMQYADKLFGVFQRLHAMSDFEGTGIGLAIVKRIITRHGGRVWAQGKVNEGATIYFALPTKGIGHG
jgi:PAS domain S-box-containing protein